VSYEFLRKAIAESNEFCNKTESHSEDLRDIKIDYPGYETRGALVIAAGVSGHDRRVSYEFLRIVTAEHRSFGQVTRAQERQKYRQIPYKP
jgi:hypothetical protein